MDFIINNNHPFTIVEEELLRKFCFSLNPAFIMIKATAMKNKIISKYLERKADVIACLHEKGNSKVSSTTDLWTSGNHFAMIAVTGTWINRKFEMREGILGFRKITGQHSGVNIAESFYGVLAEYQIADKVKSLSLS
jgi:hypothetical protein